MFEQEIKNYLNQHGFEIWNPEAVLFDMDGVLIDSMPNHAIAWQQSMHSFGLHMTEADAYATEGARGVDTIRQMARAQWGRDITPEEAQKMYDEKTRLFHAMPTPRIMPGILTLLSVVKAASLTIGVVTGSGQRPLICRLTSDFGEFVTVDHIVTAYDVSKGKPHPEPYLQGMRKCGATAQHTIIIENAPLGVQSGHASEAFTIGVNTGPLPAGTLKLAGADLELPDMETLAKHIHELMKRRELKSEN